MKKISNEQIEEIRKLLRDRNTYAQIKEILDKLEEVEDELRDKLRGYLMNQGKSDISKKDVWRILDETK